VRARDHDGREAVREARRLRPDVVLTDVRMPVLDGIAATRELAGSPCRVLMLTTFDLDEYVYDALRAGGERIPAQGRPAGPARGGDP
jgi:DNA-binding NarL/FixJ family response regulator